MINRTLDLLLYRAFCPADGCSEGSFRDENASDRERNRHQRAMQITGKYLRLDWGLQLSMMYDLVHSEEEAQEFVKICQEEFEGITLIIKLSHCVHGKIIFDRKVEFENYTLDDIDDLIDRMRGLDYMKSHEITYSRLQRAFYQTMM